MALARPLPSSSPDVAGAQAALEASVITRVAGTRPVHKRRWFPLAAFYAASLATGALVSMAGGMALEKTGLKEEARLLVSPSVAIESAPQQVAHWIEIPSTPFLEAGRRPDGTLSVRDMLEAWNDAGMPAYNMMVAMQEVQMLRPTLLARADIELKAHLEHEARQAAERLIERNPKVYENLKAGRKAQGEKVSQSFIDQLEAEYADVLPDPDWSLEARVTQALAWNASEEGRGLSLKIPEILQPGITQEGFSLEDLLNAWQAAGVDPSVAFEMIEASKRALPKVGGMPRIIAEQRLDRADTMLNEMGRAFAWEIKQLSHAAPADVTKGPPPDRAWVLEDWESYWKEVREKAVEGLSLTAGDPAPTMEEAKQALVRAAQATGLRSLSPSLSAWDSTTEIVRSAERLEAANRQLEAITGWQGKVLGLDGRVELSLGTPVSVPGLEGLVAADDTGRLQMTSNWAALGHEWFHAFDYAASSIVMTRSNSETLSENLQPLRRVDLPEVRDRMKNLLASMHTDVPIWKGHREAADQGKGGYWVRPAEVLAFGFASYARHIHGADALFDRERAHENQDSHPHLGPSLWEARTLDGPFQDLFAAAAPLDLSGKTPTLALENIQAARIGNVAEWRASRAQVEKASPVPKIESGQRYPTYR